MWQDYVFALGQLIFVVALLPALASDTQKPPRATCWMTGVTLVVFALCFGTLGLWWAFSTTFTAAVMWLALALQQRNP